MTRWSLSSANRRARLHFAFGKVNFDWTQVIFSSETVIGGVVTWGFATDNGPGRMRLINGSMSSVQYVAILDDLVLPFVLRNENMILIQVNDYNYVVAFTI